MSNLTTTIASLDGFDAIDLGGGSCRRSTEMSSVPRSVAIGALQFTENSIMMKVTFVTLRESSLMSFDRC